MRLLKITFLAAMVAMFASTASALSVEMTLVDGGATSGTVTGLNSVEFGPGGGQLELDVTIRNFTGLGVNGIGTSIQAEQGGSVVDLSAVGSLDSGANPNQILFDFGSFTGLQASAPFESPADGLTVVRTVNAISTTATTATGESDQVLGGNGGQYQVILNITGSGDLRLVTATGDSIDGDPALDPTVSGLVNVTVVPEPGTALLMGLGLVGLSIAGRRE